MPPLVSIIINNYNYGRFVRQAIESALAQTYSNVEIIIVDDGSQDESRDIISEYADRAIVVLKPNGGQASAFNAGISRARGEYTLLLDSDDYLFPDAVEACVQAFPRGYARVYFRLRFVDANGESIPSDLPAARFELVDGDAFGSAKDPESVFLGPPTSGNFFDTATLKSILPVPEIEFRICADAFVLMKTCLKGPVKGLDRELGAYRIHGGNAFSPQRTLFSSPKRVRTQISNYFSTRKLLEDACIEKGLPRPPLSPSSSFWLIHLFCAGRAWDVGELRAQNISRGTLLRMVGGNLISGQEPTPKRVLECAYLLLVLLLPLAGARKLLRIFDYQAFGSARVPPQGGRHSASPADRFDGLLERADLLRICGSSRYVEVGSRWSRKRSSSSCGLARSSSLRDFCYRRISASSAW